MSTGTLSSLFLTDGIAVGVVVVSGPTPALSFTPAETNLVYGQVLIGTDYLASVESRARVSFSYDYQPVTVNVPNGGNESTWVNAALAALGYASTNAYVAALQSTYGAKWAYVAFFTKYDTFHFAYAGGNRVVMQYENDNWGPTEINRVFAHETGHIFGAADEYAKSNCTCARSGNLPVPGSPGLVGVENFNCEICLTPLINKVPCLMDRNTKKVCTWSRGQFGWGYFRVSNNPIADFAGWAGVGGVQVITGDFNGNGRTDIALVRTGGTGWATQPVAFSNGDGTFNVTNAPIADFAGWASSGGVQVITGDFNGNGRTDIALVRTGGTGWDTVPIAFSVGDGRFEVSNINVGEFSAWATASAPYVGKFLDNSGLTIALVRTGGGGWATQPLAAYELGTYE